MTPSVCAVVVTCNRRDYLRAALLALARQTRPPDEVLVLDTGSRDGSPAMVAGDFPRVVLIQPDTGGGSAEGFHEGVRVAHGRGFDWLWLLHDDAEPTVSALEELLQAADAAVGEGAPVLLASKAVRRDGGLDAASVPRPNYKRIGHAVLAYERGLQPLRSASFVSVLVSRAAIDRHGLPATGFSAGSEGLEFTARLLREGDGYLAPRSVVEHSTELPAPKHAEFPAHVRDRILMLRSSSWGKREKVALGLALLRSIVQTVRTTKSSALVLRAVGEGALRPLG